MVLTMIVIIAVLVNIFAGFKDLEHSRSEIFLRKFLSRANYEKVYKETLRTEAVERSAAWHRYGGAAYFLTGLLIGFAAYKIDYIGAISLSVIIWLVRVVVFNPIIAVGLDQPFYYLGSNPIDAFFKKYLGEKLAYGMAFFLVVGGTILLAIHYPL